MKIWPVPLAVAAVFAGIAAASWDQGAPEGEVRVAFFPNVGHAIPIVGIENGFFGDDSTEVSVRVFESGPQAIESLFAGAIDLAYVGPGPAVSGYLNSGSGNIVVLSGAASGGSSFVARPGSGMSGAGDLAGRTVAAPQIANTQDVSLRSHIAAHGLETAERGGPVVVINAASPEIYTMFAKGDIDAAWVPEPWASILVSELDGKRLFREESMWPDGRFASVLLVARADYTRDNPAAIRGWLEGHERTASWIAKNPAEAEAVFDEFMQRELRTSLSPVIIHESFQNTEITPDVMRDSIETFAERAYSLGYLGRDGAEIGGIYYDAGRHGAAGGIP